MPARSPMPLMVHSTCRAPAWTAASEFATARPRSLWQWTLMIARLPAAATSVGDHLAELVGRAVAHRVRDVDRGGARVDRRQRYLAQVLDAGARRILRRELHVVHVAPGEPHRRPPSPSSTCARVLRSLYCRWMSLVAMKVWMRGRSAPSSADAARVMSAAQARARPATVMCRISPATARTASNRRPTRWGSPLPGCPRRARRASRPSGPSRGRSCCSPATARRRAGWCRRSARARPSVSPPGQGRHYRAPAEIWQIYIAFIRDNLRACYKAELIHKQRAVGRGQ